MNDGPAEIVFWAVIGCSWLLALASVWEGRNDEGRPWVAFILVTGFVGLSVLAIFIAGGKVT